MASPSIEDFQVGWVCALPKELAAARVMLDAIYNDIPSRVAQDSNSYVLGRLHGHNVVIACLPAGRYGITSAATVASNMLRTFTNIRIGLMVGIGAGIPNMHDGCDIRLGDVVVSQSEGLHGGVVQYDSGKNLGTGIFEAKSFLHPPPTVVLTALANLQSQHLIRGNNIHTILSDIMQKEPGLETHGYSRPDHGLDVLYCSSLDGHRASSACPQCRHGVIERPLRSNTNPVIHYGTIASGSQLIKNATERDRIGRDFGAKCIEMEAAGLMNDFPCLVIRGICDYADSYKNDVWQEYAAITAAAFAKELLQVLEVSESMTKRTADERSERLTSFNFGLNLFDAPDMDRNLFVGRESEIRIMEDAVQPQAQPLGSVREVLVLGGPGGIGKTQLAIAFAHRRRGDFDAIFWLNAMSDATLAGSLRYMAERVFGERHDHTLNDAQVLARLKGWLSDQDNMRWLLIFDNYDDPESYTLQSYYPYASHGTIVVTTRRPSQVSGRQIIVPPLQDIEQGLHILETRSQRRGVMESSEARRLAERLAGLPLALATAGTYLRQTTLSFQQYLQAYEERWNLSVRRPMQLREYQDRTLYTTWDLSYARLEQEDQDAAYLLKLLAYFGHQPLWYELFHADTSDGLPQWLVTMRSSVIDFDDIMRVLVEYSFITAHATTQTYSMHACIHDWTLAGLNKEVHRPSYHFALYCVATPIVEKDEEALTHYQFARLVPHALRLTNNKFHEIGKSKSITQAAIATATLARLLHRQDQLVAAETMYNRALVGLDEAFGTSDNDAALTLTMITELATVYRSQGKFAQAEQAYTRALAGIAKAFGRDHISAPSTLNSLGMLYYDQGKSGQAEYMYTCALAVYERLLGPGHASAFATVANLATLYLSQNKLAQAEQMYTRVLAGFEKTLRPNHTSILTTVKNLGSIYYTQGKLVESEQMYTRALAGFEEVIGPYHTTTLLTIHNLAYLYIKQGKLMEAEQMGTRALAGFNNVHDVDHVMISNTAVLLAKVYSGQGKLVQAEKMYIQALAGFEKLLSPVHMKILDTMKDLGELYYTQRKLVESEQMYIRALAGYKKAAGPNHIDTLTVVQSLGRVYDAQGKQAEAKQLYGQTLVGYGVLLPELDHI